MEQQPENNKLTYLPKIIGVVLLIVAFLVVSQFQKPTASTVGNNSNNVTASVEQNNTPVQAEALLVKQDTEAIYKKCVAEFPPQEFERVGCLLPYFSALTMEKSAEAALEKAKELKNANLINDCHLPAHAIGQTSFKKNDNNMGKAFVSCPQGCFEGCFHGVVEGFADNYGDVDSLLTKTPIPEVCEELGDDRKTKLHCVHGLGHGMMRHGIGKVTEKIDLCRNLTDINYRSGCESGVIMEYMNSYLVYSEPELKAKLNEICAPIDKPGYQDLMWLCMQQISDGLMAYTADPVKANAMCESLKQADYVRQCKEGISGSRHNPNDPLHNMMTH